MNGMTCRDMETLLRDMALEPEATELQPAPSGAVAHLEGCPRCSAALERERRLTASLAALAGSLEPCEVPAAVEARLLAAFREHSRDRATRRPVLPTPARGPAAWAAGIAAIIVVSLGVLLGVVLTGRQPAEAPAVELPVAPSASLAIPEAAEPNPLAAVPRSEPSAQRARAPRTQGRRSGSDLPPADTAVAGNRVADAHPETERATLETPSQPVSGFVPLFHGGDPLLLEAGQVWRVEMPRGALQSVGMPVVEESRAGRIQVDILVGEDGIARAIRLVQ
jgi:hypothetical protein